MITFGGKPLTALQWTNYVGGLFWLLILCHIYPIMRLLCNNKVGGAIGGLVFHSYVFIFHPSPKLFQSAEWVGTVGKKMIPTESPINPADLCVVHSERVKSSKSCIMTGARVLLNTHFSHACLSQPPEFCLINTMHRNGSLGVLFTAGWSAAGTNDLSGNNPALAVFKAFGASMVQAMILCLHFWWNYTEIRVSIGAG